MSGTNEDKTDTHTYVSCACVDPTPYVFQMGVVTQAAFKTIRACRMCPNTGDIIVHVKIFGDDLSPII